MILNIKYVFNIIAIIIISLSCNSYKTNNHISEKSDKNFRKSSIEDLKSNYNDSIKNDNLSKVINYSNKKLNIGCPESLLGNFICDILMSSFNNNTKIKNRPNFCVLTNDIFKAPIEKGEVTVEDIFKVFPSNHELVMVKLDSNNLELLLNYVVLKSVTNDSISCGVSISGIRFKIDADKKIRRCMVNTFEINKNKTYYLLTSNKLFNDNNINFLKNTVREKTNLMLKDVVLQYIQQINSNNIRIDAEIDGRITRLKN